MYNFRYHLVSIVSVFVALALGLLLGAAIAGSDLARDTSDSMVDSMLARFDELNERNTELDQLATDNGNLANQFVNNWAKNRLDGRTIVTLLGNSETDTALAQDLGTNLARGNAAVVGVTVNQAQLGLDNPAIRQALQKILPAVQGEDYQLTLAKRLAEEWSYSYVVSSGDMPTEVDAQIQEVTYPVADATGAAGATDGAAAGTAAAGTGANITLEQTGTLPGVTAQSISISDGITPQTAFQTTIYSHYTLTRALLSLGIISVNTNYQPLLEHKNPVIPESQDAALRVAAAWHLPYAVNGLVDGLAAPASGNLLQTNSLGLNLALEFSTLAAADELAYPLWLVGSVPSNASLGEGQPNYFVLLVQDSSPVTGTATEASANDLSCVTSPTTASGRYSVLALLSGAQAGIYGADRPQESRYPTLPTDPTGRAPFA